MASDLLGVAVTGLKVSQTQLTVTGNNITHASDETYSRQVVSTGTNTANYTGAGFVSTGVNVQSIERLVNDFVTTQIRSDTTLSSELATFNSKSSQLDAVLSNSSVGLSTGISDFFDTMQAAADDPASIPVRQLVLAQADVLSDRFNNLYSTLSTMNSTINGELGAITGEVNALASNLASLNQSIADAVGRSDGSPPNDLLDQRDEALRQLSELVSVTTVDQGMGQLSIFIGDGQALVVGQDVNTLMAVPGQTDSSRYDIALVNDGTVQIVTDKMSGGELGGTLSFRDDVLDQAFNDLGLISLSLTEAMNQQQTAGLDLNGNLGVPLFGDINSRQAQLARVSASNLNKLPADRVVTVEVTDTSLLNSSDYQLRLTGAAPSAYEIVRLSDDTVVQAGGLPALRPTSIEVDGMKITLESGSFANGDIFNLAPTRHAAGTMDVVMNSPESLAFAQPIVTSTSLSNSGTATISLGEVLQTTDPLTGELLPAFANKGELNPPLLVRFTSPTRYDILDATDPDNPVSLDPPMENLTYVPGQSNSILPADAGQTLVVADGFNAGRIPMTTEVVLNVPVGTEAANTYKAEKVTVSYTDPQTGLIKAQAPAAISAGDSAAQIAAQLSALTGVSATAITRTTLSVNDDGSSGAADFNLHLNGVDLRSVLTSSYNPVPSPLTNDLIAEAINSSGELAGQGITAVSNGDQITITASTGADLKFQVEGEGADSIILKGDDPAALVSTSSLTYPVNLGTSSFSLDVFDGPGGLSNPKLVELEGSFSTPTALVDYVQQQIDVAYGVPGKATVALNDDGQLTISTTDTSTSAKIQISGLSAADLLGFADAVSDGIVQPTDSLQVSGTGVAGTVNATTIGGTVSVTLEDDYTLASNAAYLGNLFTPNPEAVSTFFGYTFDISGTAAAGDEFYVNFNSNGTSDNRNVLKFIELEASSLVSGSKTFQDAYGDLVEYVATVTKESGINSTAAKQILSQSVAMRNSLSGVNLDEEAANLIRFEQVYNASSQVISVARDLFDTLLGAF